MKPNWNVSVSPNDHFENIKQRCFWIVFIQLPVFDSFRCPNKVTYLKDSEFSDLAEVSLDLQSVLPFSLLMIVYTKHTHTNTYWSWIKTQDQSLLWENLKAASVSGPVASGCSLWLMGGLLSVTKRSTRITLPSRLLLALTAPDKIHTKSATWKRQRGGEEKSIPKLSGWDETDPNILCAGVVCGPSYENRHADCWGAGFCQHWCVFLLRKNRNYCTFENQTYKIFNPGLTSTSHPNKQPLHVTVLTSNLKNVVKRISKFLHTLIIKSLWTGLRWNSALSRNL